MNLHILLFLLSICSSIKDSSGCLRLTIKPDKILVSAHQNSLQIKLTANNCSDSILFFLGLNGRLVTPTDKASFEKSKEEVGFALFLKTDNENVHYEIKTSYINDGKFRIDTLQKLLQKGREYFMRSSIVMEPHCNIDLEKTIDLSGYGRKKGIYKLYIVYFSGNKSTDWADIPKTAEILKSRGARLFKGYAATNEIEIIVE